MLGVYSDAACTVSLAYSNKGCAALKYVTTTATAGACPSATGYNHIYRVGGAYTGLVYGKSGANCVDATATYTPSFDFYTIGAEVPLTDFAAGTETVDP
jgi:hypothetical protein